MEHKNTIAVVTGGASGLGAACVKEIIARGGKAAIMDMDGEKGAALAGELGDSAISFKTDVTNADSVAEAINGTVEKFGGINVAINCAGTGVPSKVLSKHGPMSIDYFSMVISVNLIGTMNVIRLAAEKMAAAEPNQAGERGVIINTASVAAFEGQIGQAAYSASKAGVVGMTLPIARELARHGIRVMTIAPGLFDTPMLAGLPEPARLSLAEQVPFPKRLGAPPEFAALSMHIIENEMLNGECIRLDGSIRMQPK